MRVLQPCGTRSAFRRHLYWGEEPCELCRQAEREYDRQRQSKRKDQRAEYMREYSKRRDEIPSELHKHKTVGSGHREHRLELQRQLRLKNGDRMRKYERGKALRYNYGISHNEKGELLSLQGNRCAAGIRCSGEPLTMDNSCVDHDHRRDGDPGIPDGTMVRGILCRGCNVMLAILGDTIDRIRTTIGGPAPRIERYLTEGHAETQRRLAAIRSR